MFETKDAVREMADRVYALACELDRGDVLTHAAVAGATGLAPHEGSYDHVVGKVRRRTERQRGIATWPEVDVGYKLCTVAEQLALPALRARRALLQVRRGRKSVEALPLEGLTVHLQRVRAFQSHAAREAESRLRRDIRAQSQLFAPRPEFPRRPYPGA